MLCCYVYCILSLLHKCSFLSDSDSRDLAFIRYYTLKNKNKNKSHLNVYFSYYQCRDWNHVDFSPKKTRKLAFFTSFYSFPFCFPFATGLIQLFIASLLFLIIFNMYYIFQEFIFEVFFARSDLQYPSWSNLKVLVDLHNLVIISIDELKEILEIKRQDAVFFFCRNGAIPLYFEK